MSWKVWAKGIAAAVIGGGASAVAAVLNAAAYLKKSPLPAGEEKGE